VFDSQPLSESP